MAKRSILVLGFSVLSLVLAPPAFAQLDTETAGLLDAMRDAYERLDYDTAERRAREALDRFDGLSADQLVEIHTTLALILYGRNEPLEARTQFEAALSLDPTLELDPVLVSPKTLDFFEEVKANASVNAPVVREPEIRYVRVRDLRPAATLRSLALPGWGQLYKGDSAKGWVLIGLWSTTAAATVTAHVLRAQAETDYLDATEPAAIAASYDTFNAWHQRRTALALGAAAVWTYAAIDALVLGGPSDRRVELTGFGTSGLSVRFRF